MRNRSNQIFSGIFYTVALACVSLLGLPPAQAAIDVGVSINIAPPELPLYEQPPIPGPGYIWTPGYWAWGDGDYYWVPGTWVEAPEPGYLWTPGYWGWNDGLYVWNPGYWGPHIGFYGGVNYGFGYTGHGYAGGYWDHGSFRYNSAYNNLRGDARITNVYNRTVIVNNNSRASFNGGHGGIQARPGANEEAAQRERHLTPLPMQIQHQEGARGNPELRASANHGRPPIAATPHAGVFAGQGVMPARMPAGPQASSFNGGTPAHGPNERAMAPHGPTGIGPSAPSPSTGGTPPHVSIAAPPHNGAGTGAAPPRTPSGAGSTPPRGGAPAAAAQQHGGNAGPPRGNAGPPRGSAEPHQQREGDRDRGHQ